jgi:2-keto-4-pentenoate hydratase/2-oxohepta-3-ene-1,7-dioic acid hydratase in catechol pathway
MTSYRLATYEAKNGPRAGLIVGETLYDAGALLEPAKASVLDILADWARCDDRIRSVIAKGLPSDGGMKLGECRLRAPVLWPSAIYCAGANYRDHAAEMARRLNRPLEDDPRGGGAKPWFFLKSPRSIADPGETVTATHYSNQLDWEVELAAVIGRTAKNVSAENALDYVAGYTAANDLSARDRGRRQNAPAVSPFHHDWLGQKCFDGACPLGPWIVPACEIADPQSLALKLWVNDRPMQDSNTREMIFTLAEQIAQIAAGMTLYPGDLILTGTPAGVGLGRGEFLKAGDEVIIEIEKIGRLSNRIA